MVVSGRTDGRGVASVDGSNGRTDGWSANDGRTRTDRVPTDSYKYTDGAMHGTVRGDFVSDSMYTVNYTHSVIGIYGIEVYSEMPCFQRTSIVQSAGPAAVVVFDC